MITLALFADAFVAEGLAVAGAAAVAIPIAIHLLTRLRRQRQPWAAMRFLMEAYRRQRQRLRLEQLLLLLVRCLIVLILGLALAGPRLAGLSHLLTGDSSGRVVCLVLDDALSTQAATPDQHTRFDALRATAGKIVDALGPGDRVALWTTARPVTARIAPPTADLALVRRTLADLRSAASHSDWPMALGDVNATLTDLNVSRDRVTIILLSDFSAGTLDADHPAPSGLATLGTRGQVIVSHPMPTVPNIQIASLQPFRFMVLAEEGQPLTLPVTVGLRRFGTDAGGTSSSVQMDILGADPGHVIGTFRHDFKWSAGQASALLNLDVPVPPELLEGTPAPDAAPVSPGSPGPPGIRPTGTGATGGVGGTGQLLTLRATLQSGGDDALALDNQRLTLVELRRRLEVGVIDDMGATAAPGQLRPRDWLSLTLNPPLMNGGGAPDPARSIDEVDLAPALIDAASLARLDAALVLRPDLLGAPGWSALKAYARRGGLVWVFTPPSDAPALWANAFHDQLGLDWQPGLVPHGVGDAAAAWHLSVDTPTPEPLRLLSADWQALLRFVTVQRRLDLGTRGGQESVWLRVATSATPGTASSGNRSPSLALPANPGTAATAAAPVPASSVLMAAGAVGEGHVLFLATALDPAWSNLVTKPLFLPLVHETLRGVLGAGVEAARLNAVVCGEQPSLGPRWDGAQDLRLWGDHLTVSVLRNEHGLKPAAPLAEPGVYIAQPGAGLRLAINPDADAGNTTALDPHVLGQWLSGLGQWTWLDEQAPANALLAVAPRTDLGIPLLCLTLALLLLETWLARVFSHAQVPPTTAPADTDVPGGTGAGSPPASPTLAAVEQSHQEAGV